MALNITEVPPNQSAPTSVNSTEILPHEDIPALNLTTNATDWLGTNISTAISQEQTTLISTAVNNLTTAANVTEVIHEATSPANNGTFVFNHTLSPFVPDGQDFFHHLSPKDETLFVSLIIMGIIIPVLFVSIFALVCIRKRKEKRARRAERLLRNAQDLAMDDYPPALYKIQALRA